MNGLRVICGCSQHKAIDQAGSIHPVWTEADRLWDRLLGRFSVPKWKFHLLFQCTSWHQTRLCWDVFSHSLKQPEMRILSICECTLIITEKFLLTWRPLSLSPRQASQPLQGMVTLTHINLTELPCLLLFPGGNRQHWPEFLRGWAVSHSVLGKQNITTAKIVKKGSFGKINDQTYWVFYLPQHKEAWDTPTISQGG